MSTLNDETPKIVPALNVRMPEPIKVKLPDVAGVDTDVDIQNLSQAEIDRQTSLIRLQGEKLKLKKELLELEKLTSDIEKIRAKNAEAAMSHETVEDSLKYATESLKNHQNLCTHMKGSSAESMLHNAPAQGTDAGNYALIDHTFTTGVRFRMCLRCGKTWFPRDPDYRWAMSRPTKNSPSTGCPSPGLIQDRNKPVERGGVRLVSEIPHDVAPPTDSPFGPAPNGF